MNRIIEAIIVMVIMTTMKVGINNSKSRRREKIKQTKVVLKSKYM